MWPAHGLVWGQMSTWAERPCGATSAWPYALVVARGSCTEKGSERSVCTEQALEEEAGGWVVSDSLSGRSAGQLPVVLCAKRGR